MKKRTWKRLPAKKGHYPLGTLRIGGWFGKWEYGVNPNYIARWDGTAWRNIPPLYWWEREPDLFHEV